MTSTFFFYFEECKPNSAKISDFFTPKNNKDIKIFDKSHTFPSSCFYVYDMMLKKIGDFKLIGVHKMHKARK